MAPTSEPLTDLAGSLAHYRKRIRFPLILEATLEVLSNFQSIPRRGAEGEFSDPFLPRR